MKALSLAPFVPSGENFNAAKSFFTELGFHQIWDAGDYAGFENNGFGFILQHFNDKAFAENFMLSINVENVENFRNEVIEKKLPEKYGIQIGNPTMQPYGKEVNLIDAAGVCWHFVQS